MGKLTLFCVIFLTLAYTAADRPLTTAPGGKLILIPKNSSGTSVELLSLDPSNSTLTVPSAGTLQVNKITNTAGTGQPEGGVPAGTIIAFAAAACPTGWIAADGGGANGISQTTYANLYAVLGSTWNTAASSVYPAGWAAPSGGNFRVPDLRGSFMRGVGTPSVGEAATLAGYQTDKEQGHKHSVNPTAFNTATDGAHEHPIYAPPTPGTGGTLHYASITDRVTNSPYSIQLMLYAVATGSSHYHSVDVPATDSAVPTTDGTNGTPRTGTETRPQNIGIQYCIKY